MKYNLIITILILLIIGCDVTETEEENPEFATISGTITFLNTDLWPASGEVTVSLSASWLPSGPPTAYDIIKSTDLSSNTFNYTFENIPLGYTYGGIGVAWENPDETYNSSCNKSILGALGGASSTNFSTVESLVTSTTEHTFENKDFNADFTYAVPNSISQCEPACIEIDNQTECEDENHCMWHIMENMAHCMIISDGN